MAHLLPKSGITTFTRREWAWKKLLITIVNGVVRAMGGSDEKIRIQKRILTSDYVVDNDWIHVMYQESVVDLIPFYTQIAAVITHDDVISKLFPLSRSVETLIQPTIEAECGHSDLSTNGKIAKALDEAVYPAKFAV
jgi:hypothetical protein